MAFSIYKPSIEEQKEPISRGFISRVRLYLFLFGYLASIDNIFCQLCLNDFIYLSLKELYNFIELILITIFLAFIHTYTD